MLYWIDKHLNKKFKQKYNLKKIDITCDKYQAFNIKYQESKLKFILKFVFNININFIKYIIQDKKNKMVMHCIDSYYNPVNITSFIIYRKIINNKSIQFVILLIAVHPTLRECGYGKFILDEFIKQINTTKTTSIILHSTKSSINFYLKYGFVSISYSRFISNYEGNNKLNFLLKYTINTV